MAEHHHKYTGALLILFALLILLGGILLTISQSKIMNIDEYKSGNSKLNSAKNNVLTAYILAYIAAGMGLVLAILYFGHVTWGIKSEIPHLLLFIILFGLVVTSGIFSFVALSNISGSNAQDKKGSEGWIWAALIAGLVSIIVLIVSGAWRAQHVASNKAVGSDTLVSRQSTPYRAQSEYNFEPMPNVITPPNYAAPTAGPIRTEYQTTGPGYTAQGMVSRV